MESGSLVSVIIPAFNCSAYIKETIDGILSQGVENLEIIVVNDGSVDDTREKVLLCKDNRVRLIDQKNSGVCAARNRGLSAASGNYIAFMDHDDYWLPGKLKAQLNAFKKYPDTGVVFTNFQWWHQNSNGCYDISDEMVLKNNEPGIDQAFCGWVYHKMLLDSWVLTSTALAKKEVFDKIGNFDEQLPYSEDWDLWLRASREFKFLKLNQFSTLYRQHSTQGSRIVRDVDYRTILIEGAIRKWGVCSKNGESADKKNLYRKLAEYHSDFALYHVKYGSLMSAQKSFFKSIRSDPTYWRSYAYSLCSIFGWKPKW